MLWPARTIWDTRIQCVCCILCARSEWGTEIYFTATVGQVSTSPPRIAINPNRLYPIEPAIRAARRFSLNVMPSSARNAVRKLAGIRRRQVEKAAVLGVALEDDRHRIPFVRGALRTLFCEVEEILDTGDHTLMVAKVLESRLNPGAARQFPLLYRKIMAAPAIPGTAALGVLLRISGAMDVAKRAYERFRPPPATTIAETTYVLGGNTDAEVAEVLRHGAIDRGRRISPPLAPVRVTRAIGVCVVGTGWGSFHCEVVRRAVPSARLFVSGRNPQRTARLARAVRAEDHFLGLDAALADPRVQALVLALPHDAHRAAVEQTAAAGKHALVEKPIATTLADADAMITAARKSGTILMVAEDMHFRPAIGEAVRRIAQGDIGEPLYLLGQVASVRRPQGWAADAGRAGGGILMDIGVHYVHALRVLMGEPDAVLASRAMQTNTKMSGEDSVQLMFRSKVGWEAHMFLSWASVRGPLPDLVLLGDRGTLHLWPGAAFLDFYPVAAPPLARLVSLVRPYWLQRKLMQPMRHRVRVRLAGNSGYEGEVREFLAAVAEEREPVLPPSETRRDLEVVLCAYDALAQGTWATVPANGRP